MILNCVVIDDDPEALNQITSHIKRTPTLQLIGAYISAREAVRDVRNGHVDVLYLAIQMPELSGIEFARLVPESCRLVFTTAYKEYAFDGIKAGAADYLLKPISFEDFQESYKRVRATFDEYQLQDPIERDYGAQNEAYNVERGRKTPKAVYLQRVARVEAIRSAQNETFT